MSEDSTPKFTIKKRKGPSKASTSKLSFKDDSNDDPSTTSTSTGTKQGRDEEEEGSSVVVRNRGKKTPSGRITTTKGGNKLSFGSSTTTSGSNEEGQDGTTSFVKRSLSNTNSPLSTSSKRSTSTGGLLRPSNLSSQSTSSSLSQTALNSTSTTTTSSSIYSKEYLDQLKSSQLSAPPPTTTNHEEGGFDDLTMSKFGSTTNLDQDLTDNIPTSSTIAQAKLRREELRKTSQFDQGNDFISLSSDNSNKTVGLYGNKGGDSRLVREEDELGDGDEDLNQFTGSMDKVPLGKKANLEAARKLKGEIGEMIEGVEEEVEEEDEEMKQWEESQIKRGGNNNTSVKENQNSTKKIYRPLPIPQSSTLPTLSSITSRLSQSLSTIESSHSLDSASLNHFTHERQDLDHQEQELKLEVEKTERKNRWFQDFEETVEIWCGFLDEKFPRLEEIEKEYLSIQKEKFEIVSTRRLRNLSDDVSLFTGVRVPTTKEKLFRKRRNQHLSGEDQEMKNQEEEEEEDETELEPRSSTRQTRRRERQERFQSTTTTTTTTTDSDSISDPGYFTDSTLSPSQSSDLSTALNLLQTSLVELFQDVQNPEFRDPNLTIKGKFQEWKNLWKEEYEMLFGSLGLSGVWEFWCRVEMASWNPFQIEELPKTGGAELNQWKWYQALSTFGHPSSEDETKEEEEEEEEEETIDESTEVINALVTSVLIPRLGQLAKESYDPLSSKQTTSAIRLVDEVSYSVEKDSPKFEGLIQSFLYRLRIEIEISQNLLLPNLTQLSLPSLLFDPSTFQARKSFLLHHYKLLKNCLKWRRFMKSLRLHPLSDLEDHESEEEGEGGERINTFDELMVRELIGKVMLPLIEVGWSTSDGQEIGEKVLEFLSSKQGGGISVPDALKRRLQGEQVQ